MKAKFASTLLEGFQMKRVLLLAFFLLLVMVPAFAVLASNQSQILAVSNNGSGTSAKLLLETQPGSGKVYSSLNTLVGTTTQGAEQSAIQAAKLYSGDVEKYDYLFEIQSNASEVDGPSAGAAMALLAISSLQDRPFPSNVAVTGTISGDGSIGPVGGVFEKAKAASASGIDLLLVPQGEGRQVIREGGKVQSISLPEYALSHWGMKVVEVSSLDEALQLAFSNISHIDVNRVLEDENSTSFIPTPIPSPAAVQPFASVAKSYIDSTTVLEKEAKQALSTSLINDPELVNALLGELSDSDRLLVQAQAFFDQNFLFSAANNAFLARVNILLVKDIAQNPSLLQANSTAFDVKLEDLKSHVKDLKEKLDQGVPVDYIEFHIGAEQRLVWAQENVDKLESTQTLVVGGDASAQQAAEISKLQDFEFAVAWTEISEQLYNVGKYSSKKIARDSAFKESAQKQVVSAEDALTVTAGQDNEDILRRVNGARSEFAQQWYVSSMLDSASAVALAQARQDVTGKDLNALSKLLDSKVASVQALLKKNPNLVWAQLYLDHALYFQQAAKFYQAQNQGANAAQLFESGISVAYLAEQNGNVGVQIHETYDNTPSSQFLYPSTSQPQSNPVVVSFLLGLVIVLAVVLVLVSFLAWKKIQSPLSSGDLSKLEREREELSKKRSAGKLSALQFELLDKQLSEKARFLQGMQRQTSLQTIERDRLRARLKSLEEELSEIKSDYRKGKILKDDFDVEEKSLEKKLAKTRKSSSKKKKR